MAYEPTVWKTGDVVTSAKLNKIEGGIASVGALVVHMDVETGALDKTAGEIREALKTGVVNIVIEDDAYIQIMAVCLVATMKDGTHAGEISVTAFAYDSNELLAFYAANADDYPVLDEGNAGD